MIDKIELIPAIDREGRTLIFGELEVKVDYLQISGKLWFSLLFKTSVSTETFIVRWLDTAREVKIETFDGSTEYIVRRLPQYGCVWECKGFKAPEWVMAFCKFLVHKNAPKGGKLDEADQETT